MKYTCRDCGRTFTENEIKIGRKYYFIKKEKQCLNCYQKTKAGKYKGSFVYIMIDKNDKVFYVGQTGEYRNRLSNHIYNHTNANVKLEDITNGNVRSRVFDISEVAKERNERIIMESLLIDSFKNEGLVLRNKAESNLKLNQLSNIELYKEYSDFIIRSLFHNFTFESDYFLLYKISMKNGKGNKYLQRNNIKLVS